MLTKCPECELQVSDKAVSCPHCGYPLKTISKNSARHKPKRIRLPNGFGQISELKGLNLRKPFRAMVTIGKTDEGKPICKLLKPEAYFETYNDAYQALIEYNRNPYTFTNNATVEELHDRWYKVNEPVMSVSLKNQMNAAWNYCDSVKNITVLEFRPRHMRMCMEEGTALIRGKYKTASPHIQGLIKILFNKMLDFAVEYELVDRNYARTFSTPKTVQLEIDKSRTHHIPYTDEEMEKLWNNTNIRGVDIILIQCYSGFRPKEIEELERINIDLEKNIMIGGVKTKAGKDRIVPIHPKISEFIRNYYNKSVELNSKYLFTVERKINNGKESWIPYNYQMFSFDLKNIIKELSLDEKHKPHDGRAHFITQAKKYNVDEYAIKRIVGHTITDITEGVYTQRDINWLYNEIIKIM